MTIAGGRTDGRVLKAVAAVEAAVKWLINEIGESGGGRGKAVIGIRSFSKASSSSSSMGKFVEPSRGSLIERKEYYIHLVIEFLCQTEWDVVSSSWFDPQQPRPHCSPILRDSILFGCKALSWVIIGHDTTRRHGPVRVFHSA